MKAPAISLKMNRTLGAAEEQAEGEGKIMAKQQTRPASHTDLNREFATPKRTTEWNWFFVALIAFTIISSLNLRSWG